MKKLLATLLIMLPMMAIGQPKGQIINLIGMCVGELQFAETMTSYGEVPFLTMLTMRPVDEKLKNFKGYPTVMFMNPSTLSWTLAEKRSDNDYCVTAVGQNMQPFMNNSAIM
jgi:hypothetical protein